MRSWIILVSALAGLYGAAGVALAAAGAHRSGNPNVATAAYFLLFHAAALVGLCTAAAVARRAVPAMAAASLIAGGTLLFSGHLALHALAGLVPIPFAAPVGGSLTILGWLVAAVALPLALDRAWRADRVDP